MVMAALTAVLITLALYPALIRRLQVFKFGQEVRKDGPEAHLAKQGTPTMGGILILVAVALACLLWCDLRSGATWILLYVTLGYGVIGFYDDYKKIRHRDASGLAGRWKLFWQFTIGGTALWAYMNGWAGLPFSTELTVPFLAADEYSLNLPIWIYFPFALVVLVGTSNAVNLTDGLDGLAIGPVIISAFTFMILAYAAGTTLNDFNIAKYLRIASVEGAAEMTIFCAAIIGGGIGFLWYNAYPALVFMGDVGALALGGALGLLAIFTKNEILSAILHGVFLTEAISVILQVLSFKITGNRIFKMAPIHHHFELKGWPEPRVIVRFWIVSVMLALLALVSLKLR